MAAEEERGMRIRGVGETKCALLRLNLAGKTPASAATPFQAPEPRSRPVARDDIITLSQIKYTVQPPRCTCTQVLSGIDMG